MGSTKCSQVSARRFRDMAISQDGADKLIIKLHIHCIYISIATKNWPTLIRGTGQHCGAQFCQKFHRHSEKVPKLRQA